MDVVILSRGSHLYSTQSLVRAGKKRGHRVKIVDYTRCSVYLHHQDFKVYYEDYPLRNCQAIIPRVGTSYTRHGALIVRQLENSGIKTTVSAEALLRTRNKLQCLQALSQAGLPIPKTFYCNNFHDLEIALRVINNMPVVIKLIQGTHGMGVLLAEKRSQAISIMELLLRSNQKFLIQEFISEASGTDIRALVVGGKVVAAMKRRALAGDFRANLHRGGRGVQIKLTSKEEALAVHAAEELGLDVAGVDLLESKNGPLLLEVNASPGLEGIETITRVDVAGHIYDFLESLQNQSSNHGH